MVVVPVVSVSSSPIEPPDACESARLAASDGTVASRRIGRRHRRGGGRRFDWADDRGDVSGVEILFSALFATYAVVGRNYAAHARELGNEMPAVPLLFLKPPSSVVANGEPIVLPLIKKPLNSRNVPLDLTLTSRGPV